MEKALKPNAEQIDLSNIELENPHLVDGKYSIKDLIDIESVILQQKSGTWVKPLFC